VPGLREGFDRSLRWFRQRRLLQVLAVYLGTSWLILEITDVFIDKLALPAWFFPGTIVLLLIGLTVVVATAIVEGGAVAAPDTMASAGARGGARPRSLWPRALLGAAGVAAVLVIVGSVFTVLHESDEAAPVVDPSMKSLAVLPFRTSGAGLETWREGLMDVLSANLDEVAGLHAIDTRTVLSRWRSRIGDREATEAEAVAVADELGARWAIRGQLVELGGQIRIDASLHAAHTGETLGVVSLAAAPDSILTLVDEASIQLLRELGEEQGLRASSGALTAHPLAAVKAYLEGEQALRRVQMDRAIAAYQRALDADSTLAVAAHGLSQAYGWQHHIGHPASMAAQERAVRMAHLLPPRERALVEVSYLLDQQLTESIERARELTERYPDDPYAWYLLGDAYYHVGYRVGIAKRDRLAPFERAIALDSTFLPALLHPLEYALDLNELDRFDRYARLYLSHDSTAEYALALRLVRDLVLGSAEDSLAASNSLANQEWEVLQDAVVLLGRSPWQALLAAQLASELASPRFPVANRFRGLMSYLEPIELWRGRLAAAQRATDAAERLVPSSSSPHTNRVLWYLLGYGDREQAARAVEHLASQDFPVRRRPPFHSAIGAYYLMAGDLNGFAAEQDTCALLADSVRAVGDSVGVALAESSARALEAMLAWQQGHHGEAAAAYREALEKLDGSGISVPFRFYQFWLAMNLLEAGEELEALSILETFDGFSGLDARAALARAQVYERRGQRQEAIRAYARVVELWKDCDPELRSTWEAAQRAVERLTVET
jgi:tetratricopeptide (TPR) repeat protein